MLVRRWIHSRPCGSCPLGIPLDLDDFVGADAWYSSSGYLETWKATTHGRAGGEPSHDLVIPSFDNQVLCDSKTLKWICSKPVGRSASESSSRPSCGHVFCGCSHRRRADSWGWHWGRTLLRLPDGRLVMLPSIIPPQTRFGSARPQEAGDVFLRKCLLDCA